MKVYKFGGASIKDARGIRNLAQIVTKTNDVILVVVSAIGKTTNALEGVAELHHAIMDDLNLNSYNRLYDAIVSQGELMSTRIVSEYLSSQGIDNVWLDARQILVSDDTYRAANIDMVKTGQNIRKAIQSHPSRLYIIQGFIAGTQGGQPTTLGREGSDYSAAIFANLLDAESVTIWKDVPGILTADPRKQSDATLIKELNYEDAAVLAASGAQIIHSKTIAPLAEKRIPLYVKPFLNPDADGSVIHASAPKLNIPVAWKK